MASAAAPVVTETKSVGMGQVVLGHAPATLSAVLGSCVGVAVYHPRLHLGALAHVVLPRATGQNANPGKFADTAVPFLLQLLERHGAPRAGLVAKIAGGACMFGVSGPMQIGEANIKAVLDALEAAGMRPAARDVGGTNGRRVALDCGTGSLSVESVGLPRRTL